MHPDCPKSHHTHSEKLHSSISELLLEQMFENDHIQPEKIDEHLHPGNILKKNNIILASSITIILILPPHMTPATLDCLQLC